MQIHEITQRPVNEVLGAMAKTLGGALMNKAMSAVDPGFAQDDQPDKVAPGQQQAAAMPAVVDSAKVASEIDMQGLGDVMNGLMGYGTVNPATV